MPTLDEWKMYARFATGLPGYLRHRVTREEAVAQLQQGLRDRNAAFLRLVKKAVFGWEKSPYLRLLKHAGIAFRDIEAEVSRIGLEPALETLRREGVFVTFEEFKGRTPIVRGSLRFTAGASEFDNPFTRKHYETQTGGSTGVGTRIPIDLDHLRERAGQMRLANDAHGITDTPTAIWRGTLPDGMGIGYLLRGAVIGHAPKRWFSPVTAGDIAPSLKYRLADPGVITIARLLGHRLPYPEALPLDRSDVIARWAMEAVKRKGRAVVRCNVSKSVRICLTAADRGWDMTGVSFVGGGEPPTEGKRRAITRVGARLITNYAMAELGGVGVGCGKPVDPTDVHLLEHFIALITVDQEVPGTSERVQALCLTGLIPTTPKIAINFITDDFGDVTRRSCGCAFGEFGLSRVISNIFSYRKLVGEGVTLVGSDIERILEQVLPERFGGTALDFQLREEESESGLTQLVLVANPRLPLPEEGEVIHAFLEAMGRNGHAGDVARATWAQTGGVRLVREEPSWTARGKFMPLSRTRARGAPPSSPAS